MKKIKCIFCDEFGEKAKEHVWPRWLQQYIVGNTGGIFRGIHFGLIGHLSDPRIQSGEKFVLGTVCKNCNNGWMNSLEVSCKGVLKSILVNIDGINKLTNDQKVKLALWSFKTALVINAGSNYRQIVPSQHYRYLFENKTVPKDVAIDLGIINNDKKLEWRQSQNVFAVYRVNEGSEFIASMLKLYKITLHIKELGIRISYFPDAEKKNYIFSPSEELKNLRIWPIQDNLLFDPQQTYEDIDDMDLSIGIEPGS